MNVCGACGRDFSSIRAFDSHRVGRHAYLHAEGLKMHPSRDDGRRCLTEDELHAAGFAQNGRGRWGLTDEMERARQRFTPEPRTSEKPRRAA
jgi:hypothetical protein